MTRDEIIRMAREAGLDDFFCRDLMLERRTGRRCPV
jgi:hypothetical protein